MKKNSPFLFQLAFVGSLHAQSFNFGISGGVNLSGVYGEQNTATNFLNLTGFNAGAFADYSRKNFTVETGLYFTTKGYNSNTHLVTFSPEGANPETINTFNATGKITVNYLELPLNLLYNFRLPLASCLLAAAHSWIMPCQVNRREPQARKASRYFFGKPSYWQRVR